MSRAAPSATTPLHHYTTPPLRQRRVVAQTLEAKAVWKNAPNINMLQISTSLCSNSLCSLCSRIPSNPRIQVEMADSQKWKVILFDIIVRFNYSSCAVDSSFIPFPAAFQVPITTRHGSDFGLSNIGWLSAAVS